MINALAYMTTAAILCILVMFVFSWIDRRDAQRDHERRHPPRRR